MNQANTSISEDDQATYASFEETIDLPPLVAPTWVAVGNVLVALIAVAITYFTEPLFRNGYWFKVAAITYFFASLGLLVTHLLGTGSRRLHFSRTIRAENDCVRVMQASGCFYFRLQDCYWHEAIIFCDAVWFRWRGQSCLLLREKNTRNSLSCGVTRETKSAWVDFFRKSGVPEGRPLTYAQWFWTVVGIALGLYLSYTLAAFASDLNVGKQEIHAIQVYCWGVLPVLSGLYGSVLTGNDWFYFSKKRSFVILFYLFTAIGYISLIPINGWGFSLPCIILGLILGSINGLFGLTIAFHLARLGEKCRQAYFFKKYP